MTWEQLVSGGLAVSFAVAFSTGFAHKLYRGFSSRVLKHTRSPRENISYVEVWECPRCRHLNRIPHPCKHCSSLMPIFPHFKTVPEEIIDQPHPAHQSYLKTPRRET